MTTMGAKTGTPERGFSLVEVVIAIGVLAGVLISISSMFILGGRQVKTGKTITEATAICHDIMETYDKLSFVTLYTTLDAASGTPANDSNIVVASNVSSPISGWQTEIARKLDGGVATARLQAIGNASPLNFGSAIGLRLTVTLTWSELGRPQSVTLSTMRM